MANVQPSESLHASRHAQPGHRPGVRLKHCGLALAVGALLAASVYLVVRLEVDLREPLKFAAATPSARA